MSGSPWYSGMGGVRTATRRTALFEVEDDVIGRGNGLPYALPWIVIGSTIADTFFRDASAAARFAICEYSTDDAAVASVRSVWFANPSAVSDTGALVTRWPGDGGARPWAGTSATFDRCCDVAGPLGAAVCSVAVTGGGFLP